MFIQIDCDKSIKKLVIEFDEYNDSDNDENDEPVVKKITRSSKGESANTERIKNKTKDVPLTFDDDDSVSEQTFEIVQKPQIEDINRTPNVSPDMQNLEF